MVATDDGARCLAWAQVVTWDAVKQCYTMTTINTGDGLRYHPCIPQLHKGVCMFG